MNIDTIAIILEKRKSFVQQDHILPNTTTECHIKQAIMAGNLMNNPVYHFGYRIVKTSRYESYRYAGTQVFNQRTKERSWICNNQRS